MKETTLAAKPDAKSPAGADVRLIMNSPQADMIHSTVPPGQTNRATVHATVSEFWHILSGEGDIWRRDAAGERITPLRAGTSIDIPVGTAFQYRCTGDEPLRFVCITMPRWPGDHEATFVQGAWTASI